MRYYLFEKEIRQFALKRSGNNAMIMYFFGHFTDNFILIVNTDFGFRSRSGRGGPFEFADKLFLLEKKDPETPKNFLMTVENYDLYAIRSKHNDRKYHYNMDKRWYAGTYGCTEFSRDVLDVLILRSPHNNLASVMAKGWYWMVPFFAELWIKYAREIVGDTKHLAYKVNCIYDKWFTSLEYRKQICYEIGLEHTDAGLNRMRRSRRSSFNGMKYQRNAQKMKVLDRWKHYVRNQRYLDVLRNDELIDLTERIFGYNLKEILPL